MTKYLVTYDLVGTDEDSEDYEHLIDAIESHGPSIRVQKSVWLIKSQGSVGQVFRSLWRHTDGMEDRLFVVPIGNGMCSINELCGRLTLEEFFDTP